ncbi:MAG: CPBP family intramembrane metalloprotease [Dehalococcoidia bacterium]|nr:CPBP family intramembrane metalloprotease [Dehalococcoidia bacterium]
MQADHPTEDPPRLLRPLPPWGAGVVFRALVYTLAVIVALLMVIVAVYVSLDVDEGSPEEIAVSMIGQVFANMAILAGIYWYVSRRGAGPGDFGFRSFDVGRWWWIVIAFVLASYATLAAYSGLVDLLESLLDRNVEFLMPESNIPDEVTESALVLVIAALFSVGVAPLTEEMFFRGFVLGGLSRSWGLVVAVIGSSLLFGLVHGQGGLIIPFSIVGAYLAFAYLYTRSLWGSVACHLTFNGISIAALALI